MLRSTAAQSGLRSSLSLNIVKRGVVEEVGSIEASKRWTFGPLLIPASQIDSLVRPLDHMMDVSTTQSASSLLSPLVTQVGVCTFPSLIPAGTHQRTPVTTFGIIRAALREREKNGFFTTTVITKMPHAVNYDQ